MLYSTMYYSYHKMISSDYNLCTENNDICHSHLITLNVKYQATKLYVVIVFLAFLCLSETVENFSRSLTI